MPAYKYPGLLLSVLLHQIDSTCKASVFHPLLIPMLMRIACSG